MSIIDSPKKTSQPVSVFELFSIGIGPSSSHTVGPMRAALMFAEDLETNGKLDSLDSIQVELYGSLAMTGKGHATDIAILLGLEGERPEGVDPGFVQQRVEQIRKERVLNVLGKCPINFAPLEDLLFSKGKRLPFHSNAMKCRAFDVDKKEIASKIYYSVGGGFVVEHENIFAEKVPSSDTIAVPYPFRTCEELLVHCKATGLKIYEVILENEKVWRSEEEINAGILRIWQVMKDCVERGCQQEGILPGGLEVRRRAAEMYRTLMQHGGELNDPSEVFDWVSLYALAVNEENAAGGKVVTAPTNGASGVIPSVLHYYQKFCKNPSDEGIIQFFLTACAIGVLYKEGASLSAAEMGCQGEVGVACSMAAGGLAAVLGGTNEQIENAAEIGMEHNLGLTCDPIAGLVQIPCIERNTMGAIKAINAARLALKGDGIHRVSLDQVIIAMRHTGEDMKSIYKETSEGGLALHVPVNIPEC
jgi:L-serine dehydratase